VLSLEAHYADALPELRRLDASAPQILQYYAASLLDVSHGGGT